MENGNAAFFFIPLIIGLGIYAYMAVCLQTIAKKTNAENDWFAWIPIANIYLMCMIAHKEWWWLLLCLIPYVNIIFFIILWMDIAEARGKQKWLAILMLIPIVNFVIPGYLAFSE